ncbi:MAG: hypothetical protein OXF26_05000 [Alphaproteobacteria bacterium]|nr:hypothetical protein [Alphaproteobacteria bacterium]MCY4318734.1 hypothetical protein [Alphaproteobacteria bacterium]
MCALAHYLERKGIATVAIALVHEHAEAIGNPRTLSVPFELGRPLGAPDNPEFQLEVLRAALHLLDRPVGPVLEEFPDLAPEPADYEGWACPISLPRPETAPDGSHERRVVDEIARLRPWWDLATERRGRTTVGAGGGDIEEAARIVCRYADGAEGDDPGPERTLSRALKLACDDLMAFYTEAATAQPGGATSQDLSDWFWGETAAGRALLALCQRAVSEDDKGMQLLGSLLILPRSQAHRAGA